MPPVAPVLSATPSFEELNSLRLYLRHVLKAATPSLKLYCDAQSGGFVHLLGQSQPGNFSKASTATCVSFLVRSGRWQDDKAPWGDKAGHLVACIADSDWDSADLGANNAFTTSFLLEAIADLIRLPGVELTAGQKTVVDSKLELLTEKLAHGKGIGINDYPPTAFLTQKVVRVLKLWHRLTPELAEFTASWAWARLNDESVCLAAAGADADVFELAYALLTASLCAHLEDMSPRQRESLTYALRQVFSFQNAEGTFPRSRPLFIYPSLGNAYCYDYELLAQLLADPQLEPTLRRLLPELSRAVVALEKSRIPLRRADGSGVNGATSGWSTGHLKQTVTKPESWSTASAYYFAHQLNGIVLEAIRRSLFSYASAEYRSPAGTPPTRKIDKARFLDSEISHSDTDNPVSLTETLEKQFLDPLRSGRQLVRLGQRFPSDVPTSAILYGPPGTSKTQLAHIVADYIGWPLLKLDPSHLTRNGLDQLHAETNRLFTMLEASEQLVVLFDEFDELVRDRDEAKAESVSRFLTTAMLPKLAALSERRTVVYLLATNHLERFDPAISRPGRFDMIVPVMPPTLKSKCTNWPQVDGKLTEFAIGDSKQADTAVREQLGGLTFLEFKDIVDDLMAATNRERFASVAKNAADRATVNQPVAPDVSWSSRIEDQRKKIRIPKVSAAKPSPQLALDFAQ